MVTVQIDRTLQEVQTRFRLTEEELDRAFERARRRAAAAGYDRAFRQLKRITGEGKLYWVGASRVFSSIRHTGDGKIWVGLNPDVLGPAPKSGSGQPLTRTRKGALIDSTTRIGTTFANLPTEFEAGVVRSAMEQIFEAELEKAAIQTVSR